MNPSVSSKVWLAAQKPAAEMVAVGVDQHIELLRVCFLRQTKVSGLNVVVAACA